MEGINLEKSPKHILENLEKTGRYVFHGSPFKSRLNVVKFHATKETMDQIKDEASGYVYVFEKEKFKEINFNESVSHEEVEPIMFIEVTKKDLPEITIKDF